MVSYCTHAFERAARMDVYSEEKLSNYAERAWKRGKTPLDFSGKARTYLLGIEKRHCENVVVRIFAGFCFVFRTDGMLITEYAVAKWVLNSNHPKKRCRGGEDEGFASCGLKKFAEKLKKGTVYDLSLFVFPVYNGFVNKLIKPEEKSYGKMFCYSKERN